MSDDDRRVIDAAAEVVELLRGLTDEASELIQKLPAVAADARAGEAQAVKAVVHLQERLRLGAQMLKAFQSQIGRIDNSLAQIRAQERRVEAAEARMRQHAAEIESRAEAAMQQFAQRLNDMVCAAMEKISRHAEERAAHAAAPSSADSPTGSSASKAPDLNQLAATMQEVAQRIVELAAVESAGAGDVAAQRAGPDGSAGRKDAAEIHVRPPLRFHTWAMGG